MDDIAEYVELASGRQLPEVSRSTREKRRQLLDAMQTRTSNAIVEAMCPSKGAANSNVPRFADLNGAVDECGNTLLHVIVTQKDLRATTLLLQKGAGPNVWNNSGISPLRIAKLLQAKDIADVLLKHGAQPDDLTQLDAATDGNEGAAADADQEEASNSNPMLADPKQSADLPAAKSLKSHGLSRFQSDLAASPLTNVVVRSPTAGRGGGAYDAVDRYGATPLMKAAYRNEVDLVTALLNNSDGNADAVDLRGYSAMIWACLGGATDSVRALISYHRARGTLERECGEMGNAPESMRLTALVAAAYCGHQAVVAQLIQDAQVPVDRPMGNGVTALMVATWMGNFRAVKELLKAKAVPPKNCESWIVRGLSMMMLEAGGDVKKAQLNTPAPKLPNGKTHLQIANDLIEVLRRVSGDSAQKPNSNNTNSVEEKFTENLKMAWGARIATDMVRNGTNESGKLTRKMENSLKQSLGIERQAEQTYEDELSRLLQKFRKRGTILDVLLMNMVKQVLSLIIAARSDDKTQYVVIAGKAIQEAGEIVRLIEAATEKRDAAAAAAGPAASKVIAMQPITLLLESPFMDLIFEMCKTLRNEHVMQMLTITRLAVGAWPPPNAVVDMINLACKMATSCHNLVNYANALGIWPAGEIDLQQFSLAEPADQESVPGTRSLDYKAYQRQQETSLLEKISKNAGDHKSFISESPTTATASPTNSATASIVDNNILVTQPATALSVHKEDAVFFASVDNLVRIFAQNLQKLKVSKDAERKEEYSSEASAVYASADAVIEEIRSYYVYKSLPDDFKLSPEEPVYKRKFKLLAETLLKNADELILRSKLASGIWPTPDSVPEMMKATVPVIATLKQLVSYVKEVARVSRQTENEERRKEEQFMRDWIKNQQVRNLFSQWESIHLKASKNANEAATSATMTDEEAKILNDSDEGLLIEVKDKVEIVKAGRLFKLVERLADHRVPDAEYRSAFLLTHHSFTTSLDLLDVLIKRYDINPPYGLDQRLFNLFVNKKIVPVRLRVYNVLKIWMSTYSEDFIKNRQLTERCIAFVQTKMSSDFGEIAVQLMDGLRRCMHPAPPPTIVDTRVVPKSILPRGVGPDDLGAFLAKDSRAFIDIDPLEMARQLTLVDFNTYKSIRPKECLDQGWEKSDKATRSPNITKIIKQLNNMTMWVVTSIVQCEDIKARMALIRYFISVANCCRELNNFNGITAIIAGFSMGPVHRMTRTWRMFQEKFPKFSEMQDELSELVSAKGQYSKYRQALKAATPPILPFLGVYLTDLTFIELGNADFLPETNYINFDKRRKVAANINYIQQYQQTTFSLAELPQLRDFILRLGATGWMDEKGLYAKSWEVEPREESVDEDEEDA